MPSSRLRLPPQWLPEASELRPIALADPTRVHAMTKKIKTQKLPRRYQPGFLRRMDRRTSFSKRLRAVFNRVVEDLGGEDQLSTIQLTLVERFAWLKAHLQLLEDEMAKSSDDLDPKTVAQWVQSNNCLMGLAKTLGLKRAKAAPTDIKLLLRGKRA